MIENRKYCMPEFVFKNVVQRSYQEIYLIAIIGVVPVIFIYLFLIRRFFMHGGLALFLGLLVIFMCLIIKALSRTVRIYFDQKSVFIDNGKGVFRRYLQKDTAGIYSYEYNSLPTRPRISISLVLKNGKSIHLNDGDIFERADQQKALMLKQFLTAARKRLDLVYVKRNKWRAWQGAAAACPLH